MKKKVLMDLDGVLAATPKHLLNEVQKRFDLGKGLKIRDQSEYNVEAYVRGLDINLLEEIFHDKNFWYTIPTFANAEKLTKTLKYIGAEIHIVTDRRWYSELEAETRTWLRKNHISYDELAIVRGKEKYLYAKENDIEFAIEDNINNAWLLKDVCPVILMDWPYNRDIEEHENIYVAENYSQVVEIASNWLFGANLLDTLSYCLQSTRKLYLQ